MNKYRWNWLLHQRIWCEWMNHTIGKTNNHCFNITAITNKIEEYMCDYNYSNAINRHLQMKRQDQNRTGQTRQVTRNMIRHDAIHCDEVYTRDLLMWRYSKNNKWWNYWNLEGCNQLELIHVRKVKKSFQKCVLSNFYIDRKIRYRKKTIFSKWVFYFLVKLELDE